MNEKRKARVNEEKAWPCVFSPEWRECCLTDVRLRSLGFVCSYTGTFVSFYIAWLVSD